MTKDPKKIKIAYDLINKIEDLEAQLDFWKCKAERIANGEGEVNLSLDIIIPKKEQKESIFDRDGFLKTQFQYNLDDIEPVPYAERNNNYIVAFSHEDAIERIKDYQSKNTPKITVETSSIKRTIKDTVALEIIGIISLEIKSEKRNLESKLNKISL